MRRVKIQVFCPKDAAEKVRITIGEAGGGHIGNYDFCISATECRGYFRPLEALNYETPSTHENLV